MKWLLTILVLVVALVGLSFLMAGQVWAPAEIEEDATSLSARGGEKGETIPEEALKQQLEEEVRIEVGDEVDSYGPAKFMEIFPGLEARDFDGVKSQVGQYVFEGGELVHKIGDSEFVYNATYAVSNEGIGQMVDNVTTRIGIDNQINIVSGVMNKLRSRGDLSYYENRPVGVAVEIYDGISVSSNETEVDLSQRGLTGSLKAEVRNLSNLTELDLSYNEFTGLPAEVGQLERLRFLNLAHNNFTGLPHELGNLKNLTRLDLRGNEISEYDLGFISASLPDEVNILTD